MSDQGKVKPTAPMPSTPQELADLGLFEARYYDTYRIAGLVKELIENPFEYIRQLEGFYVDDERYTFLEPFPKESHFHKLIRFVIEEIMAEDQNDFDLDEVKNKVGDSEKTSDSRPNKYLFSPLEMAFENHHIEFQSFHEWILDQDRKFESATANDLYDYYCETRLTQDFEDLISKMVEEVFYITFLNRKLMRDFNKMMAVIVVSNIKVTETPAEYKRHLKRDGILRRVDPPMWAKKAIFFRERGKCAITRTDLSGLLSTLNKAHYDHIVPLAEGGMNDISNLQLLAEDVNLKKSASNDETSIVYERWY